MNFDTIYSISMFSDFATTVAIMSSCREMRARRIRLYSEKHLILYGRPIVDIWPNIEKNYYVGGCFFGAFIMEQTFGLETSKVYEWCNTVQHMVSDWFYDSDFAPKFNIVSRYLVLWRWCGNNSDLDWMY